jgi:hypothetical protein
MERRMPFSWRALVLAPLAAPFVFAALLAFGSPGRNRLAGLVILTLIGGIVSYPVTIFMLLPCMFLLSRLTRLTAPLMAALGAVLAFAAYWPEEYVSWNSSGVDSGPPSDTYMHHMRHVIASGEMAWFLGAGVLTALLFWWLAGGARRPEAPPAP